MPLDGKEIDFDIALKPNLSRPSLEALAYILRHKEEWPKGHVWDFSVISDECDTAGCAHGIANRLWGIGREGNALMRNLRIPPLIAIGIFWTGERDPLITPEVVASRIEDHLAGRPVRYLIQGDRG